MFRLRCVQCNHDLLERDANAYHCGVCGRTYPLHAHREIPVLLSDRSPLKTDAILNVRVETQAVDLHVAKAHWQTGTLADLLESVSGKELLNYGAGDGGDRAWLESKGYRVTTFDIYPGDHTDYICDGHELPFSDQAFDVVTSTAVFEHLYDPFQAAREMYRVLRDGGAVVGSAAFLEPFHANSYFHMSHLGLREVFQRAGFRDVSLYPGWSYLEALNGNFWIWNQVRPLRRLALAVNRAKFVAGRKLWDWAYAVKGKPVPDRMRLGFCGSLLFKAVR